VWGRNLEKSGPVRQVGDVRRVKQESVKSGRVGQVREMRRVHGFGFFLHRKRAGETGGRDETGE
jgi:hypothetical protein